MSFTSVVRCVTLTLLTYGLVQYAYLSRGWPLVHDMQVMHYVSFLIDRGWAPYRQIGDMNMPGAYVVERGALHLFGSSDLGWRAYDYFLGALLIAASAVITRKTDWIAGYSGAACFTLVHGYEGPRFAGQRDQVMAVLLVISVAALLETFRQNRSWLMFAVGLSQALAISIKPTVALFTLVLIPMAAVHQFRLRRSVKSLLLYATLGFAVVGLWLYCFLAIHQSVAAFFFVLTKVLPHYTTFGSPGRLFLLRVILSKQVLLLLAGATLTALLMRYRLGWEDAVLVSATACGFSNYWLQGKGFPQHQYVMLAFVFVLIFKLLFSGLQATLPAQVLSVLSVCAALGMFLAHDLPAVRIFPSHSLPTEYLERDLRRLGEAQLQGNVQCLDIVGGCLAALFHQEIVQETGATGDLLYFLPSAAPIVQTERAKYWETLQNRPPDVFVLFNTRFEGGGSFSKVQNWPDFSRLLDARYVKLIQRDFPDNREPVTNSEQDPSFVAYRIYARRGSTFAHTDLK